MTKEKAMEILSNAFNSIFDEISSEVAVNKVDIEQDILMSQDIEKIKSLVEKLNTIDIALRDIGHRKDVVNECIADVDRWSDYSLLSNLNRAFNWLPEKDEAE